jgi:DNA-directed RNA polymerase subunit RPC12/RpoP
MNVRIKDVTDDVSFGSADDESLPITKCICGQKFEHWTHIISIYADDPIECPNCGAKLYFRSQVRVFMVVDSESKDD